MTRKLTSNSLLSVVVVSGTVLIILAARPALAQTTGTGHQLARSLAASVGAPTNLSRLTQQSFGGPREEAALPIAAALAESPQTLSSNFRLFKLTALYESLGPSSVAVADVNGDGKPDLVVADRGDPVLRTPGTLAVRLGNGDGTFQAAVSYSSGGLFPSSVAIADVNGDGKPDLVVANECPTSGCLGVLLGNGDGTFQTAVMYSSGGGAPQSVAVADVNGDGKRDLLVGNRCANSDCSGNASVGVLLGNGDGTFKAAVSYDSGGFNALSLAVLDINADGKPDLLVANQCGSQYCADLVVARVGVLLGNGDGTFQAAVGYDSGGLITNSVAVADVNGDGKPDLLVSNLCPPDHCIGGERNTPSTVGVLLGNGDGTFKPVVLYNPGGYSAIAVAVADVNADGKLDLLVANARSVQNIQYGSLGVLLGNGDGTFQAATSYLSGGRGGFYNINSALAVADVNADGRPDVLMASCVSFDCGDGNVGVLLAQHAQTQTVLTTSGSPSFVRQAVTFRATMTSVDGAIPNGGLVTFYDGGSAIGTGNTAGGVATLTTASLPATTQTIKATFAGDALFKSSSGKVKQVVLLYPTTTHLRSSENVSGYGHAVTFVSRVQSSGPYAPTGKVAFKDGANWIGYATLSGGLAKLSKSNLAVGTHAITAEYLGDAFNAKSTSSVVSQVVK